MNTFKVGKWYRFLGNVPTSWRGGPNSTSTRQRVADHKPRFCTAVNETGDWCSFRSIPPNVNHPEGLWDWTDGIENWQEVSITVVDDLIVYNCPKCGRPPKMMTEKSSTISPISSYKISQLNRTYSCCDIEVSGQYPHVLDAWNSAVVRELDYKHFIMDIHDFIEKVCIEYKGLGHKKEFAGVLKNIERFMTKQYEEGFSG